MRHKKGLSDIVTNVLIIVLVLGAIILVWSFVNPLIRGGTGKLQGASDCISLDVRPISCNITTQENIVVIERGVGEGNLAGVRLIITNSTGRSTSLDFLSASVRGLQEYGQTQISFSQAIEQGSTLKVAVLVQGSQGLKTCSVNPNSVTCTS